MEREPLATCFPPIVSSRAKVLILGSFPGKESLRKQEYYGHPRNVFWFVISGLFHIEDTLSYPDRVKALAAHGVALWDVLLSCRRKGSLDSSIDDETVLINDFLPFFQRYKEIKWVFFNGTRAEKEYRKHVLKTVEPFCSDINYHRLPSTSPAMAMLTKEQKLAQWSIILKLLD
jgi:TDG/mug DNA glycosylase family protein